MEINENILWLFYLLTLHIEIAGEAFSLPKPNFPTTHTTLLTALYTTVYVYLTVLYTASP